MIKIRCDVFLFILKCPLKSMTERLKQLTVTQKFGFAGTEISQEDITQPHCKLAPEAPGAYQRTKQ